MVLGGPVDPVVPAPHSIRPCPVALGDLYHYLLQPQEKFKKISKAFPICFGSPVPKRLLTGHGATTALVCLGKPLNARLVDPH